MLNASEQSEALKEFQMFFRTVENRETIDNPLMIEIIAELYAEKKICLKSESFNLYEIFEKIIEKQRKTIMSRIESNEHVLLLDKIPVPLDDVHQIYALTLFLLEECQKQYGLSIDDLSIVGYWRSRENPRNRVQISEEIQRYGILTITLDETTNKVNSIDFIHRTYAEFFVAKFLSSFISSNANVVEINKVLNFLVFPLNRHEELKTIREFVLCKIKHEKNYMPNKKVSEFISNVMKIVRKEVLEHLRPQSLEFCSFMLFSSEEMKVLKDLWLIDRKNNLLKKILCDAKLKPEEFKVMFETLNRCFGKDWHQMFSSTEHKLIVSNEIQNFEGKKNFIEFNQNFLKILRLIEKNFSKGEKEKVLLNFIFIVIKEFFEYIHSKIFEKCFSTFKPKSQLFSKFLVNLLHSKSNSLTQQCIEVLSIECFKKEIGKLSHKYIDKLKSVLFIRSNYKHHPLFIALTTQNLGVFKRVVELYTNCGTSQEKIQNIFLRDFQISTIILNIQEIHFQDFVDFLKNIFKSDESKLIESIRSDRDKNILIQNPEKFELFRTFLANFLGNEKCKVKAVMSTFLMKLSYVDILLESLKASNTIQFKQIIKVCEEYKESWIDIQNEFVIHENLIDFIINMTSDFSKDFSEFMLKVFYSNTDNLLNCISNNYEQNLALVLNEDKFKIFVIFMLSIFKDQKKNVIRTFLLEKLWISSHPLIEAISLDDSKMFNALGKVYFTYRNSSLEIQEIFTLNKNFPDILLNVSAEFYEFLINFLKKIFESDKKMLQICLEEWIFKKEIDILFDEKKFKFVKDIYDYLFDDDEIKNLKSILLVNDEFLIKNLEESLLKENFKNFSWTSELCSIFKTNEQEMQNIFISLQNLFELFAHAKIEMVEKMCEFFKQIFATNKDLIIDCLGKKLKIYSELIMNEERFKMFECFLVGYYDNNANKIQNVINIMLFQEYTCDFQPLFKALKSEDVQSFIRIKDLYIKYGTCMENIQDIFAANKDIFILYFDLTNEMREHMKEFLKEIFEQNKTNFFNFLNHLTDWKMVNFVIDKNEFESFVNLTSYLFDGSVSLIRNLFFSNDKFLSNGRILKRAIFSDNLEDFQWVRTYFTTYKNSWEDIQDILASQKIFPEIFYYANTEIQHELCEFVKEVFASNRCQIYKCFKSNCNENFNLILNEQTFKLFEDFVIEICDNDQNEVRMIINKYLYYEYSNEYNPLLIAICSNNLQTFERISIYYNKYKNSKEELQDFLLLNANILKCFEIMTYEMCIEVTKFCKTVFQEDILQVLYKLREHIKNKGSQAKLNLEEQGKLNLKHFMKHCFFKNIQKVDEVLDNLMQSFYSEF